MGLLANIIVDHRTMLLDCCQGLMESAEGLETSGNARLSAQIDKALEKLPAKDTGAAFPTMDR